MVLCFEIFKDILLLNSQKYFYTSNTGYINLTDGIAVIDYVYQILTCYASNFAYCSAYLKKKTIESIFNRIDSTHNTKEKRKGKNLFNVWHLCQCNCKSPRMT